MVDKSATGHATGHHDQAPRADQTVGNELEWVDIPTAAMQLGISERAIRLRIKRGTLTAKKRNGRRYVAVERPAATNDATSRQRVASGATDGPGVIDVEYRPVADQARQQLMEVRDEWLLPLVEQIGTLERENGRLSAELAHMAAERDEFRTQLTALSPASDIPASSETVPWNISWEDLVSAVNDPRWPEALRRAIEQHPDIKRAFERSKLDWRLVWSSLDPTGKLLVSLYALTIGLTFLSVPLVIIISWALGHTWPDTWHWVRVVAQLPIGVGYGTIGGTLISHYELRGRRQTVTMAIMSVASFITGTFVLHAGAAFTWSNVGHAATLLTIVGAAVPLVLYGFRWISQQPPANEIYESLSRAPQPGDQPRKVKENEV